MEELRQLERRCLGRQPEPFAGRMDSQTIKTATPGEEVGFDGGKKIKGRKRHLLVDTLGLRMAVGVPSADTDDRLGLGQLLTQSFADGVKRLRKIWVDGAYPAAWLEEWGRSL
jgi:putative transposase